MPEFENGFEEDENPVLPPQPAAIAPSSSLSIGAAGTGENNNLVSSSKIQSTSVPSTSTNNLINSSSLEATQKQPFRTSSSSNGFSSYTSQPPPPSRSLAENDNVQKKMSLGVGHSETSYNPSLRPDVDLYRRQLEFQQQLQQRKQQHQMNTSLGRIPIIGSASSAQIPSSYLSQQSHLKHNQPLMMNGSTASKSSFSSANDVLKTQAADLAAAINATTNNKAGLKSTSSSDVIDLTAVDDGDGVSIHSDDDDDEVIVDETPICIGQLTSLALIIYPVSELMTPVVVPPPSTIPSASTNGIPGSTIPNSNNAQLLPLPLPRPPPPLRIKIIRAEKHGTNETLKLITPVMNQHFGVMEHKVANVLGPLLGNGTSGEGVTKTSNGKLWCEASVIRRGERNPMMLPLHLLLFTRPIDVPMISHALESAVIYLEHPMTYDPAMHGGYKYNNPHNPAPGVSSREEAERRRRYLGGGGGGIGSMSYQTAPRQTKAVDAQVQQVHAVFENLKSGLDLEELEPPAMVTTKLYPHQKQALSFLLDRERLVEVPKKVKPNEEVMVSLWQRKIDVYGRACGWVNTVTGTKIIGAKPPTQSRGSILADDMGLGKTIAVIALIATTLTEAKEWAQLSLSPEEEDDRLEKTERKGKAEGMNVGLSDFGGRIYGDPNLSTLSILNDVTKPMSKKQQQAAAKKHKKLEDAKSARFQKIVTRSRATLIVCPLSTVQNWESQFDEHVGFADGHAYNFKRSSSTGSLYDDEEEDKKVKKGQSLGKKREKALSIYVYHGNARTSDARKLADYDVVITTFSTLGTEYSKQIRAEDEREEEEAAIAAREGSSGDEAIEVFDAEGNVVEKKPLEHFNDKKRKRKKVLGSGVSPLQQVQWFRVVLDEAHIIKEHTTIQARAACELSASRRTALSGTPLQNSLNDLFSLVRFLRLEPFTDRHFWNEHIGVLAKNGNELGVSRLQLIMRHLTLRRTKATKDKNGKPILSLPPNEQKIVHLSFDPAEHAFYSSRHSRYKHDFKKLMDTDSIMKNYCSILQEVLRLRQICVHMSLVKDSEDAYNSGKGEGEDLIKTIEEHGISKPRAIQLLSLMRDAGEGHCVECDVDMLPFGETAEQARFAEEQAAAAEERKPPAKKGRKKFELKSATASAANTDDELIPTERGNIVITKCQHLYCRGCFADKVYLGWPDRVKADERAKCTVCNGEFLPALDAVEFGMRELQVALENAVDENLDLGLAKKRSKKSQPGTRFVEHSTKTKALIADLFPFSQANPASLNFWGNLDLEPPKTEETGGTIGFQPVKGEVVKSVVFSQWTKLLDRVGDALDEAKIHYRRLDGAMNRDQRTEAMETFKCDPACEVLLVSLRAGGVGLNLTSGRRVYLMEPFWNPAVEQQAIDRCYRIGQTRSVQTTRFIISHTIEENILKLQKRKTDLANMSLSQTLSKAELAKRKVDDLKLLMSQ